MDNFTYRAPTRYVFGRGAEGETGALTAAEGCRKVLVVSGGGSARRSGLLDRVEGSLRAAGVAFVSLTGIRPNPTDDRVYEGIALCRAEGPPRRPAGGRRGRTGSRPPHAPAPTRTPHTSPVFFLYVKMAISIVVCVYGWLFGFLD